MEAKWSFITEDSRLVDKVSLVLLDENSDSLLTFDLFVGELLKLLNGNNRRNYEPVNLEVIDDILSPGQLTGKVMVKWACHPDEPIGEIDAADIFRQVVEIR